MRRLLTAAGLGVMMLAAPPVARGAGAEALTVEFQPAHHYRSYPYYGYRYYPRRYYYAPRYYYGPRPYYYGYYRPRPYYYRHYRPHGYAW